MATVDVLVTKYQMDNSDYVRGAKQVDDATMKNQRSMDSLARGIAGATTIVTGFVGAVGAATTALVALGTVSIRKSSEFDAMVKALEAIEGSAKGAGDAIEELRKIAARPGLGLEEAISGYSGLRRAGLDRDMSMRILGSAGNANALAGGGREELSRILLAITQIAMKPNLSGEELMQLNEGGIAASRIIGDAFGTFDGAELKKMGVDSREALEALVEGMEAMPQAASSAKNSIENLQMGIDMALVGIGSGLTTHLIGPLDELGLAISRAEESGLFETLGDTLGMIVTNTFPELTATGGELEDQLVVLAARVADVAQALGNLKMNIEDITSFGWNTSPAGILDQLTNGGVSRFFGGIFGEINAGQAIIDQTESEAYALAESDRFAQRKGCWLIETGGKMPPRSLLGKTRLVSPLCRLNT
jgi:tape measure domain-containing protein